MIQITRIDEATDCPDLASIRTDELERVRKALAGGATPSGELVGKNYSVAKLALYQMQHYKCCYCESIQDTHLWNTVEHYRPKVAAEQDGQRRPGYWWLTWTWSNLLFSCEICNHRKGASFPLSAGSTPLATEKPPPDKEIPLLLDPSGNENPRAHIQFLPVAGSWWPFPRNGSLRGMATLTALKLYHPELGRVRAGLLEKWRRHAVALKPAISRVQGVLPSESEDIIRSMWATEVTPHLYTNQQFVALSIDMLDHAFGSGIRERWGLALEPISLNLSR